VSTMILREKFKCGCRPGYDAVLPNATEVMDPVPVEWRPLKCLSKGCVRRCCLSRGRNLHCIFKQHCSLRLQRRTCRRWHHQLCTCPKDCRQRKHHRRHRHLAKLIPTATNSRILFVWTARASCKSGFYQSNGKGQCINENECADGYRQ
jgi:hypothetical protein